MKNEWGDTIASEASASTTTARPRTNDWGDRSYDPFAPPPGTLGGMVNTARRAGRQALAGLDVMGALARGGKRDDYAAEADNLESQAAEIETLAPTWTPEARTTWAARARSTAAELRKRAGAMQESQSQQLTAAAKNVAAGNVHEAAPDYREYQQAHGWDAVRAFLKNPVEVPLNIAIEGAVGSVPTLAAGAAGAVTGGVPGMVAGTGLGSFTTEYASTVLGTIQDRGVDAEDPAALQKAFGDPEIMAEARKRGVARGIPVAIFDAISGGLAGRTIQPVAKAGLKQLAKATAKEVGEQAALGMAGETAGQVSEQLATTGEVDPSKLKLKDIVAEGIGEVVPGVAQVATGALTRSGAREAARGTGAANGNQQATPQNEWGDRRQSDADAETTAGTVANAGDQKPGMLDLSAEAERQRQDAARRAKPQPAANAAQPDGADLDAMIASSLPDDESRDVLSGRSAEASARALKDVKVDFGQTVESVKDSLLASDATPAQLDALDFQLRVLEERKDKRRLKPDQVNASLANTFLMEALPAPEVFPLVSRLAEDSSNIAALRKGIADMRTGAPSPALNAQRSTSNTAAALSPEERAARVAALRSREEANAAVKEKAEADREQQRAAAVQAEKEKTVRVKQENETIRRLEATGRDPQTKRIVDLTRVPDAEIDMLDAAGEGLTQQQIDTELERRARAAERAQAEESSRGEDLLDALRAIKLPSSDEALGGEMAKLTREEMTPKQRMELLGRKTGTLDNVGEALRDRGYAWAQTPADVVDGVQRALRGEKIYATRSEDGAQFRRTAPPLRPVRRAPADLQNEQARWWENLWVTAPGVARQVELRFGRPEDLVESGDARAEELTGQEEAVYVQRRQGALRGIIHLFDHALRTNEDAVTRLNLVHEMGHAFFDTLDAATRDSLVDLWLHEIETRTGPLFDGNGKKRQNVAELVETEVQEWFAERLAHANDLWAKRRIESLSHRDTIMEALAARFRELLLKLREYLERAFGRNGYSDTLTADFRKFLDQGDRWNDAAADPDALGDAAELAGAFSKTGLPVRRAQAVLELDSAVGIQLPAAIRNLTPRWQSKPLEFASSLDKALYYAGGDGNTSVRESTISMIGEQTDLTRGQVASLARTLRERIAPLARAVAPGATVSVPDQMGTAAEDLTGVRFSRRSGEPADVQALRDNVQQMQDRIMAIGRTPRDQMTAELRREGVELSTKLLATEQQLSAAEKAAPGQSEPRGSVDNLLREYSSLERTRDRYMREDGRVPRHINTGLADLRIALEEALPGWRSRLPQSESPAIGTPVAAIEAEAEPQGAAAERVESLSKEANRAETQREARTERSQPEPEQGVGTLFEEEPEQIEPQETAQKFAQLEYSSLRGAIPLREWLKNMVTFVKNFRSAIPELPGGAVGRQFAKFRHYYKLMKTSDAFVREQADAKINHVLKPMFDLGRESVSPRRYRELQELQAERQKQIDAGQPVRAGLAERIAVIKGELDEVPYHLFRKIVLHRDLYFRSKLTTPNGAPLPLPFGLTAREIEAELRVDHEALHRSPQRKEIEESLRRHYALVKEVRDELLARGYVIPEDLRNPLYFPHMVLEKASGKLARVAIDTAHDFRGYLVPLKGSVKGIEADYVQAMYAHMVEVAAHNRHEDLVEEGWHKPYDAKERVQKELAEENERRRAEGLGPVSIEQRIPKGYVEIVVDQRIPLRPGYLIDRGVLAERLGVALGDGDLQRQLREKGLALSITADDLRSALIAQEKVTWIVPVPIAQAMRGIMERDNHTAGIVERILSKPNTAWKQWTLFAPQAVVRYSWGNIVADVEKLFAADPAVFKKLLPAAVELWNFYRYPVVNKRGDQWGVRQPEGKASADLQEAFRRGVIDSVTAAEVTALPEVQFQHYRAMLSSPQVFIARLRAAAGFGRTWNQFREATFRYAKFKLDLERMRAGSEPVYAGAFNRDVKALEEDTIEATHYARATEISWATFGNYGDISVSGTWLRRYLIPFYSWMEINFRYHVNLFRNLGDMTAGAGAAQIARGTLSAASRIVVARSVSGVLLRLALPFVAVGIWNAGVGQMFAQMIGLQWDEGEDLEKTLSAEDRRRFHIVLGKDAKGKTVVMMLPTAFSDFIKWFGGNEFARLVADYVRGDIELDKLAHEWASNMPGDSVNNVAQGLSPMVKAPLTAISRRAFFPDILDPRTLPDHELWWNVLGQMTDGFSADMIRRVADKDYYSSRDFGDWSQQLILQARRRDPDQWGYYATLDRVEAYKAVNTGSADPGVNNRVDAQVLANFRKAIRAADIPAAMGFYQKLLDRNYTSDRFRSSVDHSDPLATLKREHRQAFYDSLSPAEQEQVKHAYRFAALMKAFDNREKLLFAPEKAVPEYKAEFAAQGGRADVFEEIMRKTSALTEQERETSAEDLLSLALQPRARRR